jgi:NAD(P)-dependent dehydrogenase (short-subunit alcohol dehydrogenase family)
MCNALGLPAAGASACEFKDPGAWKNAGMDLELSGKRAVVTGASRGIGLAVARGLVAEGADVALIGRDRERLERAAEELAAAGPSVLPVVCDTGFDEAVARMAQTVTGELGAVDILVNCAAKVNVGPMRDEDLDEHLNVKLKGYLRCTRAFAPAMAQRGWGRIVNVSGLAARQTGSVVGSVRNVAVAAMTKNLADEYGAQGVNVTVVHPALTRTERTPDTLAAMATARGSTPEEVEAAIAKGITIGRIVTAEEVASVIVFLASPRSVSITGDAVAVGGGARGGIYY